MGEVVGPRPSRGIGGHGLVASLVPRLGQRREVGVARWLDGNLLEEPGVAAGLKSKMVVNGSATRNNLAS